MLLSRVILTALAALALTAGAAACASPSAPMATIGLETPQSVEVSDLTVDDRMGSALVGQLQQPLETGEAAPLHEYEAGDVAYVPRTQSLVIFVHAGAGLVGGEPMVRVGSVASGLAELEACVRDCRVTFVQSGGE